MNRDDILALPLGRRRVPTYAWGVCYVRQLRADELPALLDVLDGPSGAPRLAGLAILGTVDENGAQVFRPEDLEALATKALEPVGALADAFLELNDIQDPGAEKKSHLVPSNSSDSISQIGGASRNPA